MSDNWIVQILENNLDNWNEKLNEIWFILTESPAEFKGRWNLEHYIRNP